VLRSITSSNQIDELFRSGKRYANPYFVILVFPSRENGSRVLIVAGKRLGGAVIRNRLKRVMRESARMAGGPWEGYQVAIIARSPLKKLGAHKATAELSNLLRSARLMR